jgi:trans-2,3-dihydro-3-hydroxyanthranilate isomerase
MRLRYRLLNVFSLPGDPFSGNPLCVFEDACDLNTAQMQALARQFNLSETTFVSPSSCATAAVRIFTPDYEMPFAGHPTLGTAAVVHAMGKASAQAQDSLTLEMPAGVIPVSYDGERWTFRANTARHREFEGTGHELAGALGLAPDDLRRTGAGARPLWVDVGNEQLIVPLSNEASVRRCAPLTEKLARWRSANGHYKVLVFAELTPAAILARFFFDTSGAMAEDPATGSACANLGGWYLACGEPGAFTRTISQGEQVQRPSELLLRVDRESRIFVGGRVWHLGSGEIDLSS